MRGINFVPNSFIKTSALSINNLYPKVKCSWYLLFNSQNPTSLGKKSLYQQVSRIIKQDIPLRSVWCCLLPIQYTEIGTLNRQKRQRSHYMALLGIILTIHFLLLPSSLLILCLFVGLRVFEGVWHFRNRSCLLRISIGKLRKHSVSARSSDLLLQWGLRAFYLATVHCHQLERILLILPCLEASQHRIRPFAEMQIIGIPVC